MSPLEELAEYYEEEKNKYKVGRVELNTAVGRENQWIVYSLGMEINDSFRRLAIAMKKEIDFKKEDKDGK